MKDLIGMNVLLTCSACFYAPDGVLYRGVWGKLKAVHEAKNVFGFVPNRAHANWIIEIGDMQIMGCQVLYSIKCPNKPDFKIVPRTMYTFKFKSIVLGFILRYKISFGLSIVFTPCS